LLVFLCIKASSHFWKEKHTFLNEKKAAILANLIDLLSIFFGADL